MIHKNLQHGGATSVNVIENTFIKNNQLYNKFFNPIYGLILFKLNVFKNYILFGDTEDQNFIVIKELFNLLNVNELVITNNLKNLNPEIIGGLIAILYKIFYIKNNLKFYSNIKKKLESLSYNNSDTSEKNIPDIEFPTPFSLYNNILEIQKNTQLNLKDKDFIKNYINDNFNLKQFKNIDLLKIPNINPETLNIVNKIILKKYSNIEYEFDDFLFFHTILGLLWVLINNKKDIFNYYRKLNETLEKLNLKTFENPLDYEQESKGDEQDSKGDEENYFENMVIKMLTGDITLLDYGSTNYNGIRFEDCGESTLRNFFQILLFNNENNKFDTDILEYNKKENELDETLLKNIKEFFTLADTTEKQNDEFFKFNDDKNIRNKWSEIVSGIDGVEYAREFCEINPNYFYSDEEDDNILKILKKIFNINSWKDLDKLIKKDSLGNETKVFKEIKVTYTDNSMRRIIEFTKPGNKKYRLNMTPNHFYFDTDNNNNNSFYIEYDNFKNNEYDYFILKFLNMIFDNNIRDKIDNLNSFSDSETSNYFKNDYFYFYYFNETIPRIIFNINNIINNQNILNKIKNKINQNQQEQGNGDGAGAGAGAGAGDGINQNKYYVKYNKYKYKYFNLKRNIEK